MTLGAEPQTVATWRGGASKLIDCEGRGLNALIDGAEPHNTVALGGRTSDWSDFEGVEPQTGVTFGGWSLRLE